MQSATRIGIYGGGQLGAYLCEAAPGLGLSTTVMAFSDDSMAKGFADRCIVAPKDDLDAVAALIANSDVITFELEDVPASVLQLLAQAQVEGRVEIAPSLDVMKLLQNKYSQKQWLRDNGFPTAEFVGCDEHTSFAGLVRQFGLPFVQKANQGGYDGKGVQVIKHGDQAEQLWRAGAYAERYIDDKRELAVLVARSATGETSSYPVVEMLFDEVGNVLDQAQAPATIAQAHQEQALALGEAVVDKLHGVGVFAIEMFLTASSELLINEISPRVHNTGHMTMEAHATSQYAQHLLAITGRSLGDVTQSAPAVMRNILYSDGLASAPDLSCGANPVGQSTYIHWYGKQGGKPLRKMGHITALGDDLQAAQEHAAQAMHVLLPT